MTEEEAMKDLYDRGVWRMAPGLWADKSVAGLIQVAENQDTALCVRAALENDGSLPDKL
jgi:hypothetical protein